MQSGQPSNTKPAPIFGVSLDHIKSVPYTIKVLTVRIGRWYLDIILWAEIWHDDSE